MAIKTLNSGLLSPRNHVLKSVNYIVLILGVLIILGPICMLFNISFKSGKEYLYSGLFELPVSFFNIQNYIKVVVIGKFFLGLKNTAILIGYSVFLSMMMGLMVSYVLDRFDFRFKTVILNAFILSSIIPTVTTQVATFSIIKHLHLFNTIFAGVILYVATDIIQIYLFLQYMKKIPKELDESGMVDGASYLRIFFSIIVPLMGPALATIFIIKALYIYNDLFIPYVYMPGSDLRTVTMSIYHFYNGLMVEWNVVASAIILVMVPTIIVYIFCQRYIVKGLTEGAVKG